MKRLDLSGQHFGKLTVESCAGTVSGKVMWDCKCQCGNRTKAATYKLRMGEVTSCQTCPPSPTLSIRARNWQSLLGPELTEQLIESVYAEIGR